MHITSSTLQISNSDPAIYHITVKNLTVNESEFMTFKAENSELKTTLDRLVCSKLNSAPLYKKKIQIRMKLSYSTYHNILVTT
jgi:hypothetical protein